MIAWRSGDLYFHRDTFPTITSENLFGNRQPLVLEIGCGTGEFLCELAARAPALNHLGVDVSRKPLYRAVTQAAAQSLRNIKFIHADMKLLYPLLAPDTLQTVHVRFPVPGLNRRQRKNRIITPVFFDAMHRALVAGGRISVITDNVELFELLMQRARADQRFRIVPEDEHSTTFDEHPKSYFQQRWERRGRSLLCCELEKRQSG